MYVLNESDAITILRNFGGKSESEAQCYWGALENSVKLKSMFRDAHNQDLFKSSFKMNHTWHLIKNELKEHDDVCQAIWKSTSKMALLIIGCILIGFVLLKCGVCCYKCWTHE